MTKATQISVRLNAEESNLLEEIRNSFDVPAEISNAFIVRTAIKNLHSELKKNDKKK